MAASEAIQTISRLTPLADVLVVVDAEVKPVTQRTIDVSAVARPDRRCRPELTVLLLSMQ